MNVGETDVRRGAPVDVRGNVQNGSDPCGRVTVEIALRDAQGDRPLPIGTLATDEDGRFAGVLIVPFDVPAGDYEVVAHTPSEGGCAEGFSR